MNPEMITEENIQRKIMQILWLYNNERPHSSLGNRPLLNTNSILAV
ncbi:MAG: transposase [Bacteroidetes bacterium]|nr:transposase [Bacteroidota bacterium]